MENLDFIAARAVFETALEIKRAESQKLATHEETMAFLRAHPTMEFVPQAVERLRQVHELMRKTG